MTGALPNDAQAIDRAADGPVRDLDPMMIVQVSTGFSPFVHRSHNPAKQNG